MPNDDNYYEKNKAKDQRVLKTVQHGSKYLYFLQLRHQTVRYLTQYYQSDLVSDIKIRFFDGLVPESVTFILSCSFSIFHLVSPLFLCASAVPSKLPLKHRLVLFAPRQESMKVKYLFWVGTKEGQEKKGQLRTAPRMMNSSVAQQALFSKCLPPPANVVLFEFISCPWLLRELCTTTFCFLFSHCSCLHCFGKITFFFSI